MAESFVYARVILDAVRSTRAGAELAPIALSDDYLKAAGDHARWRVITGGLRLGELLQDR